MREEENMENKRVVAYIRTGSKDDDGAEQGLEILEFCEREHLELVRILLDIGASGLDTNRKGLNEMLRFLEDKKNDISSVIVTDFSKLSRDLHHSFLITERLLALQISIRNVKGDCISKSNITESYNNMYMAKSDRSAENIKAGIKRAKKEGFFPDKAPFGYRKEQSQGRPALVVDNEKSELVNCIFRLYLSDISITQLSLNIRSEELISLDHTEILKILRNPVYAGLIDSGGGNLIKGKHFPIVSESDFRIVQDLLKKEPTKRKTARVTPKKRN